MDTQRTHLQEDLKHWSQHFCRSYTYEKDVKTTQHFVFKYKMFGQQIYINKTCPSKVNLKRM